MTQTPQAVDTDAAVELVIFATNTGDLYRVDARPVIACLARRIANGTFDETKAPGAFAYWAERAAREYAREICADPDSWSRMFPPSTRAEAAKRALAYYRDVIEESGDSIACERANRRRWTLAAIRRANTGAGRYFFSRATLDFFGDTMRNFRVIYEGPAIFIERRNPGDWGDKRWEFHPRTGELDLCHPF